VPQLLYSGFIELLADAGYTTIATPYAGELSLSDQYGPCCLAALQRSFVLPLYVMLVRATGVQHYLLTMSAAIGLQALPRHMWVSCIIEPCVPPAVFMRCGEWADNVVHCLFHSMSVCALPSLFIRSDVWNLVRFIEHHNLIKPHLTTSDMSFHLSTPDCLPSCSHVQTRPVCQSCPQDVPRQCFRAPQQWPQLPSACQGTLLRRWP
jgi:hypothetical protein